MMVIMTVTIMMDTVEESNEQWSKAVEITR